MIPLRASLNDFPKSSSAWLVSKHFTQKYHNLSNQSFVLNFIFHITSKKPKFKSAVTRFFLTLSITFLDLSRDPAYWIPVLDCLGASR